MAANMNVAVFWDGASGNLVDIKRHVRGSYCHHHDPNVGGSKHIRNDGQILLD
jgi:hypothetical protein